MGAPSVPGCHLSFTWKAPAEACRFVGVLGGADVGRGAAADGLEGDAESPPFAAMTAPTPPSTRISTPTMIRSIGSRRRDARGPGVSGDGATTGEAGRPGLARWRRQLVHRVPLPFGPRGSTTRRSVARRGAVASAVWRRTPSRSEPTCPRVRGSCAPPDLSRPAGAATAMPPRWTTCPRASPAACACRTAPRTG